MLTKMEVHSALLATQKLPLNAAGKPSSDPIQILGIEGLDPVKAVINTVAYGSIDGESFVGSSVGKRNIVIKAGLNPDWAVQTIEELRKLLYSYFLPQSQLTLRFTSTHLPVVQIAGIVEDMSPNIFSRDPEYQISIICPEPDFTALERTIHSGSTSAAATPVPIDYQGSVTTGFYLQVESPTTAYTGPVTVQALSPAVEDLVLTGTADAAGVLQLSTQKGSKFARRTAYNGDILANILRTIPTNAVWPRLRPGMNQLNIQTSVAGPVWQLAYYARYGGL